MKRNIFVFFVLYLVYYIWGFQAGKATSQPLLDVFGIFDNFKKRRAFGGAWLREPLHYQGAS